MAQPANPNDRFVVSQQPSTRLARRGYTVKQTHGFTHGFKIRVQSRHLLFDHQPSYHLRLEPQCVPTVLNSHETLIWLGFAPRTGLWQNYIIWVPNNVPPPRESNHDLWHYLNDWVENKLQLYGHVHLDTAHSDEDWNGTIDFLHMNGRFKEWLFQQKHQWQRSQSSFRISQPNVPAIRFRSLVGQYIGERWSKLLFMDLYISEELPPPIAEPWPSSERFGFWI